MDGSFRFLERLCWASFCFDVVKCVGYVLLGCIFYDYIINKLNCIGKVKLCYRMFLRLGEYRKVVSILIFFFGVNKE